MKLDNVTLVAISGRENLLEPNKKAIRHCLKLLDFQKTLLLSSEDDDEFHTVKTPILDLSLYNKFCIEELHKYIQTDYCLLIQPDGFVLDTKYWTDEFLEYDYIGAPWFGHKNAVGNGGFSLRSKKFLQACSKLQYESNAHLLAGMTIYDFLHGHIAPEDWFACLHNKEHMNQEGIKFPSAKLAYQFSVEYPDQYERIKLFNPHDLSTYKSFGFHGSFNVAAMKEIS